MSVSKYQPHLLVIPEDDANRQMANGFVLELDCVRLRNIQVLQVAGGWMKVLKRFQSEHVSAMEMFPERLVVLLIDFDGKADRLSEVAQTIPNHLIARVFILGAWTEPEDLRERLGSYETIGKKMALDCRDNTNHIWGDNLLRHNVGELDRLRERVRPILF